MGQFSWAALLGLMLIAGPVVPQPPATQAGPLRVTVYPWTLGQAIDEFAGQRVRIPNARVVSVLEPRAFVIESASPHDVGRGYHDRTLVLLDSANLRVTAEQVADSTVVVFGVAKTIVGTRLLSAPAWPASLDRERMKQLEVRAVVIATSVQAADGTELTQ